MHDLLLTGLLEIWEQNILVLDEELVGHLLVFPPLALWKEIFHIPDLEISLPAPSVRLS